MRLCSLCIALRPVRKAARVNSLFNEILKAFRKAIKAPGLNNYSAIASPCFDQRQAGSDYSVHLTGIGFRHDTVLGGQRRGTAERAVCVSSNCSRQARCAVQLFAR